MYRLKWAGTRAWSALSWPSQSKSAALHSRTQHTALPKRLQHLLLLQEVLIVFFLFFCRDRSLARADVSMVRCQGRIVGPQGLSEGICGMIYNVILPLPCHFLLIFSFSTRKELAQV